MVKVLTSAHKVFILKNYLQFSTTEMGETIGAKPGTIKSFLRSKKLEIPKALALEFRLRGRLKKISLIVHPEDELIKELYLLMPQKTLATLLGRSHTFVLGRMEKLGLQQPPELIREFREIGMIKPGAEPPNKGKKQTDYMSPEAIERTKATRFKKGQKVHNEAKDGDIRIRDCHPERGGTSHKYIRIKKGVWLELQIYNWKKENGPVPKGYVLACKDGNTLNCETSNWYLLSKADNARRNAGYVHLPDNYVAHLIAGRRSPHLKEDFLKNPELIELKRNLLLLNRKIKSTNNGKQQPTRNEGHEKLHVQSAETSRRSQL